MLKFHCDVSCTCMHTHDSLQVQHIVCSAYVLLISVITFFNFQGLKLLLVSVPLLFIRGICIILKSFLDALISLFSWLFH